MKKHVLFLTACVLAGHATSQITITSSDFASVGDQYIYFTDTSSSIVVGPSGSSQTWDFTSLTLDLIDTTNAVDPSSTPDGASFPSSNLAVDYMGGTGYLTKTTNSITQDGFAGSFMGFGSGVVKINPPQTVMQFPSTVGTTFNSPASYRTPAIPLGFSLPCGLTTVIIDSARIHHTSDLNVTFNASGTLNLPTGSYNSIRSLNTDKTIDSIFIYADSPCLLFGLQQGWQLAPALLVQQAGFAGNPIVDTIYTYNWYANMEKNAVCTVTLNDAGNPGTVEFNANSPFGFEDLVYKGIKVYPNPAVESINIDVVSTEGFNYQITDMQGKVVLAAPLNGSKSVMLTELTPGAYILKLTEGTALLGTVTFTKY